MKAIETCITTPIRTQPIIAFFLPKISAKLPAISEPIKIPTNVIDFIKLYPGFRYGQKSFFLFFSRKKSFVTLIGIQFLSQTKSNSISKENMFELTPETS